MILMELLDVVGRYTKICINENSAGLPRLYYGDIESVTPNLNNRKVMKVRPGMMYNNFTLFISIQEG